MAANGLLPEGEVDRGRGSRGPGSTAFASSAGSERKTTGACARSSARARSWFSRRDRPRGRRPCDSSRASSDGDGPRPSLESSQRAFGAGVNSISPGTVPVRQPCEGMSDSAAVPRNRRKPRGTALTGAVPLRREGVPAMSDKEFKPFVPADSKMTEFTGRALVLGLADERHPRRGERLPRPEGRHDDRRDLSGGRHRHGGPADLQGLAPRGELRPNRRLDRRVGGGGRDLHDPGVRHPRDVEVPGLRRRRST